jgi:two-component system sensor histidine kinase KdpD
MVCFVWNAKESSDKIALDKQRHLINNFKLATQLGAEVIKQNTHITDAILEVVAKNKSLPFALGNRIWVYLK